MRNVLRSRQKKLQRRNYVKNGLGVLTAPGGKKFFVDIEDFERCNHYLWYESSNGYAYSESAGYLHRFVMFSGVGTSTFPSEGSREAPSPIGYDIDHVNRDRCDCRRENLRVVTHKENCANRGNVDVPSPTGMRSDLREMILR